MWCFIFGFSSLFFLAVAVFIFFAACREMNHRDLAYRSSLRVEQNNVAEKERAGRSWLHLYEAEQKKLNAAKEEIKSLRQTVQGLRDSLTLQLAKVSDHENSKKSRGKKQDPFLRRNEECVVCMEIAPLTVMIPCGHLSTCMPCMKSMENPPCPVCRSIGMYYNVYDSTTTAIDKKELPLQEIVQRKGRFQNFLQNLKARK